MFVDEAYRLEWVHIFEVTQLAAAEITMVNRSTYTDQ